MSKDQSFDGVASSSAAGADAAVDSVVALGEDHVLRPSAPASVRVESERSAASGLRALEGVTPPSAPTRQFAGLVLMPVAREKLGALRALLEEIGAETIAAMQGRPPERAILPFQALSTVHYARFVVIEPGAQAAWLAFCTDYDGPEGEGDCSEAEAWQHHEDDLLRHARSGLERVLACCEGFRPGELVEYLRRHRRRASTFYVGSSGRSKGQIMWEAALRRRVEHVLDTHDWKAALPEAVRGRVLAALEAEGVAIPRFPAQPELGARVRWFWACVSGVGAAALGLVLWGALGLLQLSPSAVIGGLALGALLLVVRFRYLELTDPQFQPVYSVGTHERFETASAGENHFLQNQLTHLVRVKPGPLRWLMIRAVFAALQVLAQNRYNKGRLGDIPSIHFARWVLIPGRQVLFFSNFDSSWQSYLGDFIDRASGGLTSVWSNTVEYPRTRWLRKAGSADASRFLAWTRHYQIPTQVWYCAYPGLSIVNINDNTEIRRGLADREAIDAATWLFRLRSVDRVRTDQLYGEEQTRDPSLPLGDIQGLILWGYGHMPEARFLLLRVDEPSRALLEWIGGLPLHSAAAESVTDTPPEPLVNVAFTYQGLREMGICDELCGRFATAYFENSDHPYRTRVNGDVGSSSPEHWEWGSAANPVHVALLIYASSKPAVEKYAAEFIERAREHGLGLVTALEGTTLAGRKEHFGFRDGIAQPTIQGSGRAELAGNTVAAGEFLLGHRDGYGNVTHSPTSPNGFNVGLNGSYLVLRQLEQDVDAFWRYCEAKGRGDEVRLASKMVGRWPSGAPLVRHPQGDPSPDAVSDEDNFSYVANDEDNDRYGARCPFGSHVRRSNPRDWALAESRDESLRLANLHRIIRRGRPYGEPLYRDTSVPEVIAAAKASGQARPLPSDPNGGAGAPGRRGLQFLCFNSNIDRQFEFIQQQWCNNPKFGGLANDPDPLLGLTRPVDEWGLDDAGFTVQSDAKTGIEARCDELQRFVKVVGSSYFFMPSIPAVRILGAGLLGAAPSPAFESVPPDEQLAIDRLITDLREKLKRDYVTGKTLRDGHPKMHGLVEAVFRVEPDLPPQLAIGVFAQPKAYRAWIRFSNENASVTRDQKPDVRGAAIKLMGVTGFKLLEGQESCSTQDFVLTTREGFMVKDAAEFSRFIAALCKGRPSLMAYLLAHPRVALSLLGARARHEDLLATRYFSGLPYLLGTSAVKYSLVPSAQLPAPAPRGKGDNFLREALKKTLGTQGVSFDFKVQIHPRPSPECIEDSRAPWREAEIPFHKVATIEIPQQDFDTPARQELGENIAFNPWRCLPEHRPLGGLNRARRQVYPALSATRHARNAAPAVEPS